VILPGLLVMLLAAASSEGRAASCDSAPLLRIPLASPQSTYEASTPSGFRIVVVRDEPGWEVQAYAPSDVARSDSLLYPEGNWHGACPCQVQPGVSHDVFPEMRRVPVRSSNNAVCIRLVGITPDEQRANRYKGGWLQVGWDEPSDRGRSQR
jgi:hypothetical protein